MSILFNKKVIIAVNGEKVKFKSPVKEFDNVLFAPAGELFEAIGAKVDFRQTDLANFVVARKDETIFSMRAEYEKKLLNGELIDVENQAKIIDGEIFVPVFEALENFKNVDAVWDEKAKTIKITVAFAIPEDCVILKESIEDIWKIEIRENFIASLGTYIAKKCNYSANMENLNHNEKVFHITQTLEMEVNNGGFDQFFVNTEGRLIHNLVSAFEEIGAVKTAKICKRALSVFDGYDLTNWEKAENVLDDDTVQSVLNECDDTFYDYEDDLTELNYRYVMSNKEAFNE